MRTDSLAETLAGARVLLFDFDGPICDVFAGVPAPQVAKELITLVAAEDEAAGTRAAETDDPIEVLRIAHESDPVLGQEVEKALTAAEVRAVGVAGQPTPGSTAALQAARSSGYPVAVVSNNSAECVTAFLERHALDQYVMHVVGRPSDRPHLMKPNPYPLIEAAEQMHVDVTSCALIGDSVTDIQAAHSAGSTAIGFANKPHKLAAFAQLDADAITEDMQVIADVLGQAARNA
ncbi:HAD family hydrolase [Streptomyces sp. Iso 434]|uniref:HAD family hydrolase n=1 Tax=Streptomyces sp. Iso 434 TaxID=3062272 RepID=UPI00398114A9